MRTRLRNMLSPAPDVADRWGYDPDTRRHYLTLTVLAAAIAVVLAWGADARVSAEAFHVVRELGGRWTWATVWAGSAAALLVARAHSLRAARWALQVGASVHLLFAIGFTWAAIASPAASWMGAVLFGTFTALHVSVAVAHDPGGRW